MRVAEDDGQAFIREIEARRNSKITWKTYATWYADSLAHVRPFGVFLYMTDGRYWFEDFEREPSLFGFRLPERKNKEPYIKLEDSFLPSDIESIETVLKSDAESFASGFSNVIRASGPIDSFFRSTVTMVTLKNGTIRFFELIKGSGFCEQIKEK